MESELEIFERRRGTTPFIFSSMVSGLRTVEMDKGVEERCREMTSLYTYIRVRRPRDVSQMERADTYEARYLFRILISMIAFFG